LFLAPPTTNVIRQGSKALPTLDDRKKPNGDNRFPPKGGNALDKERIINIDTLNPYMNKFVALPDRHGCSDIDSRWTIKARVSNKGQIRTYENARGPGKLFSCDLVDQSGEIRATAFNAECDKFHSMLEIGEVRTVAEAWISWRTVCVAVQVYYIAKASLKAANRQFNTTNNDYEMTFNHDTIIEACDAGEGENIPQVQFNFIPISEIANRSANSTCGRSNSLTKRKSSWQVNCILDVIGVVKSTSDMQTIVSKASQKEFNKREILLVDEKASISVTLWGQQVLDNVLRCTCLLFCDWKAEEFDGSSNQVIAFKGIKVGDYNGIDQEDPTFL
jgi:replication factor A1